MNVTTGPSESETYVLALLAIYVLELCMTLSSSQSDCCTQKTGKPFRYWQSEQSCRFGIGRGHPKFSDQTLASA